MSQTIEVPLLSLFLKSDPFLFSGLTGSGDSLTMFDLHKELEELRSRLALSEEEVKFFPNYKVS